MKERTSPPTRLGCMAVLAMLALAGLAAPAAAHLVEVTTSVPLSEAHDEEALTRAIESAVDEAVQNAVGFEPTLVALTSATVRGERLYVRLLVADREGERDLDALMESPPAPGEDAPSRDAPSGDAEPDESSELKL